MFMSSRSKDHRLSKTLEEPQPHSIPVDWFKYYL